MNLNGKKRKYERIAHNVVKSTKTNYFASDIFEMTKNERLIDQQRILLEKEYNFFYQMYLNEKNILDEIKRPNHQ